MKSAAGFNLGYTADCTRRSCRILGDLAIIRASQSANFIAKDFLFLLDQKLLVLPQFLSRTLKEVGVLFQGFTQCGLSNLTLKPNYMLDFEKWALRVHSRLSVIFPKRMGCPAFFHN